MLCYFLPDIMTFIESLPIPAVLSAIATYSPASLTVTEFSSKVVNVGLVSDTAGMIIEVLSLAVTGMPSCVQFTELSG